MGNMMSAGSLPLGGGASSAGADSRQGQGPGQGQVTCPACQGAGTVPPDQAEEIQEALGAGDQDQGTEGMELGGNGAAGNGASSASPDTGDLASAAPPPVVGNGGDTCPECGGKMVGGKCASCGYSAHHSPMKENIAKHVSTQPEGNRPDKQKVYEQGVRARAHMRRPAPFGRP